MQSLYEWAGILLLLVPLAAILISLVVWSVKNGISPMPTSTKAKSCMLSVLPKEAHGKIYELGSGWGTLVFSLAKKYPNCQVTGLETSPIPYWFSCLRLKQSKYSNVTLLRKDFFSVDLGDAALVVCYLYPGAMKKLKAKFEEELKPGVCVVSNTFAIHGWTADQVLEANDLYRSRIYLYKVRLHR